MVNEISAADAARELEDKPHETVLLDVREPVELTQASVAGALHIPMGDIPARIADIDRDKNIICMCHVGGRSAQVAAYLSAQGFPQVLNMTGGIEAWMLETDTTP
jgi:rhodanese-related sulfurtransferase